MCKKLGRSCTLIMFASGNARYPNDVLVKGLPMDINESKLKEKFRSYGTILKVTIYLRQKKIHTTELLLLLLKIVKQHYKNLMLSIIPAEKIEDLE